MLKLCNSDYSLGPLSACCHKTPLYKGVDKIFNLGGGGGGGSSSEFVITINIAANVFPSTKKIASRLITWSEIWGAGFSPPSLPLSTGLL